MVRMTVPRRRTVAVIGSGGAGLAAALAAAKAGADVTVYEKHDRCGGTTALSGSPKLEV